MADKTQAFGGDKKIGTSLLSNTENNLKHWAVPKHKKGSIGI